MEAIKKVQKEGIPVNVNTVKEMVDMADIVIAVWDGKSRGTKHAIDYAISIDKELKLENGSNIEAAKQVGALVAKRALENQIEYCIDSTNLENNYLRNKIRNQLMPVLDSFFDGWQSGVLAAGEKLSDVEKLIENSLKDLNWNVDFDNGFLYFDFGDFYEEEF